MFLMRQTKSKAFYRIERRLRLTGCPSGRDRMTNSEIVETDIPQRLDRLPWARFHWLVVVALGITWILDGLEVTLTGSVAGVLQSADGLSLSDTQIGGAAST